MPGYVKQIWEDGNPAYPPSAARFAYMEEGIRRASIWIADSLPGAPEHGDEVYYKVASGLLWHLVYDSTIVDAHKWASTGSPPLADEVLTAEVVNSVAFVDAATVGPDVTVPLDGVYEIDFSAQMNPTAGSGVVAPKLGAAAVSNDDQAIAPVDEGRPARKIIRELAAGDVVKLQYRSANAGNLTVLLRNLAIRPVRVG